MSLDSRNPAPRVFTLDDLCNTLDRESTAIAERPLASPPVQPTARRLPSFFKRVRDYGLHTWAMRWKRQQSGDEPDRPVAGRAFARMVVFAAWLVAANSIIIGAVISHMAYTGSGWFAGPRSTPELVPMKPELDVLVEQLALAPADRNTDSRIPQMLAGKAANPAPAGEACLGTAIPFLPTRVAAAQEAERHHRLLFILNVSGDFEDSRFT
jgi:hypothetical protein